METIKLPFIPVRSSFVLEGKTKKIYFYKWSECFENIVEAVLYAKNHCDNKMVLLLWKDELTDKEVLNPYDNFDWVNQYSNVSYSKVNFKKSEFWNYGMIVQISDVEYERKESIRFEVKGITRCLLLKEDLGGEVAYEAKVKFPIETEWSLKNKIFAKPLAELKSYVTKINNKLKQGIRYEERISQLDSEDLKALDEIKDFKALEKFIRSMSLEFLLYTFVGTYPKETKEQVLRWVEWIVSYFKMIYEEREKISEIFKDIKQELKDLDYDIKKILEKYPSHKKNAKRDPLAHIPSQIKKMIRKSFDEEKFDEEMINAAKTNSFEDWLIGLPWRKTKAEKVDINEVAQILDENHYGMEKVKERIIEFVAIMALHNQKFPEHNKKLNPGKDDGLEINKHLFVKHHSKSSIPRINNIITLLGPPGVGKTSIVSSLSKALHRPFVKIALGGVRDESAIRGHNRSYVAAAPGFIIKAMLKAGVSNPIILLDEIDKLAGMNTQGDPTAAMLEVLDPEQNYAFQDHYLEIEYDLSKVMFVATANNLETIPEPLKDRMEIIKLDAYTLEEKILIAKNYLMQKSMNNHFLEPKQMQIDDETLKFLIDNYTNESGVRKLKQCLDKIARKIVVGIVKKEIDESFNVTQPIIKEWFKENL